MLLIAVAVFVLAGEANAPAAPARDRTSAAAATQAVYVALGDSLSLGFSASSPAKGFVGLLYSQFQSSLGVSSLVDTAKPGESSDSMRSGGQLADALAAINAPTDTRAVTIDTGGADALLGGSCPGHWDDPGACSFRANFSSILRQLQTALASDPGDEVLTAMIYPNPSQGKGDAEEASRQAALIGANGKIACGDSGAEVGLDDAILQEADKLGVPVANPYADFVKHGRAYWDESDSLQLHPNDAGYAAIAASFANPVGCKPDDNKPPQTTITKAPKNKIGKSRATYAFNSSEPGSTFRCSLDGATPRLCSSPLKLTGLTPGKHRFSVAAVDAAGNRDKTPAKDSFKVKKKRNKGHHHR